LAPSKKSKRPYGAIVNTIIFLVWGVAAVISVTTSDGSMTDHFIVVLNGTLTGMFLLAAGQEWKRYLYRNR